jgi:hypothetical protein
MTKYQKNKLLIISIFLSIFLFLFHNYSKNGRYLNSAEEKGRVLDTRTGTVYSFTNNKYLEIKGFKNALEKKELQE